jgi:predicted Zn-dependent protease
MRKAAGLTIIALAGLLPVLAGCETVPITGRKQLNLVPSSLTASMGIQQYQQFVSENKVVSGTQQSSDIAKVGQRIVQAVEAYTKSHGEKDRFAGYQWQFSLVQDPTANAFALPGGKVVVYTGILPIAQDDAGLATVMSHEIAHVFADHGGERLTQSLLTEMGGMALSTALKTQPQQTQGLFMSAYGLGSQVGVLLPFSRKQETEADHLGVVFMAMAGYDPHAAVGFWERMMAASKGSSRPPELLSTHPADATRIRNLEQFIPEAMEYYKAPQAGQPQSKPVQGQSQATPPSIFPPAIK